MPPAERTASPDAGLGERRHRRLRCERCLEILSTRHAWDAMTCRCGDLTVTGTPWAPSVRWTSSPGGGWSEVDAAEPEDEPEPAPESESSHPVPIGYVRHRR